MFSTSFVRFIAFTSLLLTLPLAFAEEISSDVKPSSEIKKSVTLNFNAEAHGLLQIWGVSFNPEGNLSTPTGSSNQDRAGVLIRRSEFSLGGHEDMGLEWKFMIDPIKSVFNSAGTSASDNKILQDLYVGYQITKEFKVRLGQFHIPTNREGLHRSGDLLFPERSWLGWRTGDKRDLGAAVYADFSGYKVSLGVFNGYGNNASTGSGMHEVTGRIEKKLGSEFRVGAWGDTKSPDHSLLAPSTAGGFDLNWERGPWLVQTEGSYQWSPNTQSGAYVQGAYKWADRNQLALRYDHYQGLSAQVRDENAGELGYNRILGTGNLKLQTSYRFGVMSINGEQKSLQGFILSLQTSF